MPSETILEEAKRLVHGDRGEDYGHPAEDFERVGKIWGAILGIDPVPARLVALCLVGLKLSRQSNKPKRDNLVDIAGYAETASMIAEYETEKDDPRITHWENGGEGAHYAYPGCCNLYLDDPGPIGLTRP